MEAEALDHTTRCRRCTEKEPSTVTSLTDFPGEEPWAGCGGNNPSFSFPHLNYKVNFDLLHYNIKVYKRTM
jgi:hypothetical protein